jgi:hypothetical protein
LVYDEIPSTNKVLGYTLGERWSRYDDIMKYMHEVEKKSDRVKVLSIGKNWSDRTLAIVVISDPKNIAKLDYFKSITQRLSDPRQLDEAHARKLAAEGKAIVMVTCGIHGYEPSNIEASMAIVYKLASSDESEIQEILQNTIILLCPCVNPDGHELYVSWFESIHDKYTPHQYSFFRNCRGNRYGFDLNRNWTILNQPETRFIAQAFNEWRPQVWTDLHGAHWDWPVRYFFPPYTDEPTHEEIDSIAQVWHARIGDHIASVFDEKGYSYTQRESFDLFNPESGSKYCNFRGCIGILFECADCGSGLSRSVNVPPLYGKGWTLKDRIDYHSTAILAAIQASARGREDLLNDFYNIRQRAIKKGENAAPSHYIIPQDQDDPVTMALLLETLMLHGTEIYQSISSLNNGVIDFPVGTYVIPMSQPERSIIKAILEKQAKIKGIVKKFHNQTSWSMPLAMGIEVMEISEPMKMNLVEVHQVKYPEGKIIGGKAGHAYVLDWKVNNTVKAVNKLLKKGYNVLWAAEPFSVKEQDFTNGAVIVSVQGQDSGIHTEIEKLAKELHLKGHSVNEEMEVDSTSLRAPRVALYYGKGCDQRITNPQGEIMFVLTEWGFDFQRVNEIDIRNGSLKNFDVVIFPDGFPDEMIMGWIYHAPYPGPDIEGLGSEGASQLEEFIKCGGGFIGLGRGGGKLLTPGYLDLLDINIAGEGYSSGMIVRLKLNINHPIAYGYGDETLAFYGPEPIYNDPERGSVVARFPADDIVESGYACSVHPRLRDVGQWTDPKVLANKAVIIDQKFGEGKVILMGLNPTHRTYWHRTYRLLFNALFYTVSSRKEGIIIT